MGIWNLLCRGNWNESAEERKSWDDFYKKTLKVGEDKIMELLKNKGNYDTKYGMWDKENPIRQEYVECIKAGNIQLKAVLGHYRKTDLKFLNKKDMNNLKGLASLFKLGKNIENAESVETCIDILNGWATGKGTNIARSAWNKNIRTAYGSLCECLINYKDEYSKYISTIKLSNEEISKIGTIELRIKAVRGSINAKPRKKWEDIINEVGSRAVQALTFGKELMNSLNEKLGCFINKEKLSDLNKLEITTDTADKLKNLEFCLKCFSVFNDCIGQEVFMKYRELSDLKTQVEKIFEDIKFQVELNKTPEKLNDDEVPNFLNKLESMMKELNENVIKIQGSKEENGEDIYKLWKALFAKIHKNIKQVILDISLKEKEKEETRGRNALIRELDKFKNQFSEFSNDDYKNVCGYMKMLDFLSNYSERKKLPGWDEKISTYFGVISKKFQQIKLNFSGWQEKLKICLGDNFKSEFLSDWVSVSGTILLKKYPKNDLNKLMQEKSNECKQIMNNLLYISGGLTLLKCFGNEQLLDDNLKKLQEFIKMSTDDKIKWIENEPIDTDTCIVDAKTIKQKIEPLTKQIENLDFAKIFEKFKNYCINEGKQYSEYFHRKQIVWLLLTEGKQKSIIDEFL